MVIEKLVNFGLVASEDSFALISKLSLNLDQLLRVLSPHLLKLRLHTGDKSIYIFGHLLNRLDVVAIFLIDLLLELLDQLLFVADDFGAGGFLSLDVLYAIQTKRLSQPIFKKALHCSKETMCHVLKDDDDDGGAYLGELLAIFFFFKLLPVPVDFYVFLMRLDDFVLDLVSSFLFIFLFECASVFVKLLCVSLDLDDSLLSIDSDLLDMAYQSKQRNELSS